MLITSFSVLLPVLFVMGLGYWAGRTKRFDANQVRGINELVMAYALPSLMFVAAVTRTRSELLAERMFLLALTIAFLGLFVAVALLSIFILRHSPPIGFGLRWLTAGGWAWWRPGPGRSGCWDGWDRTCGPGHQRGAGRAAAVATQDATGEPRTSGCDHVERAQRQSDGAGGSPAPRARPDRHALPVDRACAGEPADRVRCGDAALRARGAGPGAGRSAARRTGGADPGSEPGLRAAPDPHAGPALGRACAAPGLAGGGDPRTHRLCGAATTARHRGGLAARGGARAAVGRPVLRHARPDRPLPGAGLGLQAAA